MSSCDFDHICTIKANDLIPVHKYKSRQTGLTIVIAEIEGPVVNGFFCLATEAHDDDGLPHTLEHLVFLGSEKYPYKGTLDLLANRCLASGTNAWTDVDHTCYTITTAGSGGFLALLPVYLDHVLYPTLSEAGFVTEVHHISGDGTDGGVVYCEMQGRENTGESRAHRELFRAMYPTSGYSSETGGIMKNLRESTNNMKVRNYHAEFYRPENLTVIISGSVKPEEVFQALKPVEDRILQNRNKTPFVRPWQTPVSPITDSRDIKVLYPSDEEDAGFVYVGMRGPPCSEQKIVTACVTLLRYLTETAVSPLQREFVEIDDAMASRVGFNVAENLETVLYISFENVPTEKIDAISAKLKTVLLNISSGAEQLDMSRMSTILEKHALETLTSLENTPHDAIAFMLIGDVLYGNSIDDLDHRLNSPRDVKGLLTEPAQYWIDLLNKYIIKNPWIIVRAEPSIKEQTDMAEQEKKRIESQKCSLGEAGLVAKDKMLQEAMVENEKCPPCEMLTSIPVPSMDGISFHKISSWRNDLNGSDMLEKFGIDISVIPVHARVHNVKTNFVYMFATMDSSSLDAYSRKYLPLLLELLLESPVNINGTLLPYEEVVALLERDTITNAARVGLDATGRFICGPFSNTVNLFIHVELKKYKIGAKWMLDLLHNSQFTAERVRVIANKLINDVANSRKKGNKVVGELRKAMAYKRDSNVQACSMLHQLQFLTQLLKNLNDSPSSVLEDLEKVRSVLVEPKNLALHMAADWAKLQTKWEEENVGESIMDVWKNIVKEDLLESKELTVTFDSTLMEKINGGCIVGLGAIESCFMLQTAPCLDDFNHPDLAPLMLYLQYLTQLEGPMWRQIRGQGLAYGFSIIPKPNEGVIMLALYRATNPLLAYKESRNIVQSQLSQSNWEETLLQSARSSLIFEIIERVKSIGDIVTQSLLTAFKGVSKDYNKRLVIAVGNVTIEDLNRVGNTWLAPLFSPEKSLTSIVCPPERAVDLQEGFKALGHDLTVSLSLDDSILAK